jgi:hypothetical protein
MDATPAERTGHTTIEGRYATLQPLNADAHADTLFNSVQGHDSLWDYISDGPFPAREGFRASLVNKAVSTDPGILRLSTISPPMPWGMRPICGSSLRTV